MYSLLRTAPFVEGRPFLLINGDVVAHDGLVTQLNNDQRRNLIAVQQGVYLDESLKVATQGQRVTSLSKKILPHDSSGICADHYKLDGTASRALFRES